MFDRPNLTPKIARMLKLLLDGQYITRSQFSTKTAVRWLELLEEIGAVAKQKSRIWLTDANRLENLLKSLGYSQPLENYLQQPQTRSQTVKLTSDSKNTGIAIFPTEGAYLRAVLPITASFVDKRTDLNIDGAWLFIHDYKKLIIPADVTVVWIENFETFARIEHYPFFNKLNAVFFWTYHTRQFTQWLKAIPNAYLHFGDFDLSGLAIYITEFKQRLGQKNTKFYIPENLEQLYEKYGNPLLYYRQLDDPRVKSIDFSTHPEIVSVYRLIKKFHKGVEQEVLEQ